MIPQHSKIIYQPNSASLQDPSSRTEANRVQVKTEDMTPSLAAVSAAPSAAASRNPGGPRRDSTSSSPVETRTPHANQSLSGPSSQQPPRTYNTPNIPHGASVSQIQQTRAPVFPSSVLAAVSAAMGNPANPEKLTREPPRNDNPHPNAQPHRQQQAAPPLRWASNTLPDDTQYLSQLQRRPSDPSKTGFAAPMNGNYNPQGSLVQSHQLPQPKLPQPPPPNQTPQRRPSGDQMRYHQVMAAQQAKRPAPPPRLQTQQMQQMQQHQLLQQHQLQQQLRRRSSDHGVAASPSSATAPGPSTPLQQTVSQPVEHHSSVIKLAANALTPVQTLFEQAWGQTVLNVQHEMSTMHAGFTLLLNGEREVSARLRQDHGSLREEIVALRGQNAELKEELGRARAMMESIGEEGERLRKDSEERRLEVEKLSMENEVMRNLQLSQGGVAKELGRIGDGDRARSAKEYVDEMLDVVRAEFGRNMEKRMAALLKDVQEQKMLRMLAEKKLADQLQKLKAITDSAPTPASFSENNATMQHDVEIDTDRASSSERTTLIGTPSSPAKSLKHYSEHEREHAHEQVDLPSPTADNQPRGNRASASLPAPSSTPRSPPSREPSTSETQRISSSPKLSALSPTSRPPPRPLPLPRLAQSPRKATSPHLSPLGASTPGKKEGKDKVVDRPSTSPVLLNTPLQSALPRSSASQSISPSRLPPTSLNTPLQSALPRSSASQSISPSRLPPTSSGRLPRPLPPPSHSSPPRVQDQECVDSRGKDLGETGGGHSRKRSRMEFEEDEGGSEVSTREVTRQRTQSNVESESLASRKAETNLERKDVGMELDCSTEAVASSCMRQDEKGEELEKCPTKGEPVKPVEEQETEREEGEVVDSDSGSLMAKVSKEEQPPVRSKIGIKHLDLLYETKQERMVCRMCVTRHVGAHSRVPKASFPLGASWADLIGHCEKEHPTACEEFEKLSPCQVVELRQRMMGSGIPRKF